MYGCGVEAIPRDAQGNYSLPAGTLVAAGDAVLVEQHNPAMQDIAAALTGSLPRDGRGGGMQGNPLTNLADGVAPSDAATVAQLVRTKGDPGGNVMAVGPFAQIATMTPPVGTNVIRTTGFYADGDGGAAFYALKPAGTPNGVGTIGDGRVAVYQPDSGIYNILAFGAKADGITDCTPAFNLCIAQAAIGNGIYLAGPRIKFPGASAPYYFGLTINLKTIVTLEGDNIPGAFGSTASVLRFAPDIHGIIINRYNTLDGQVISPTTTGADGSIIRGLMIIGAGAGSGKHGIWMRARATLEDVHVKNFPGNNINIVASTGATPAGPDVLHGNANGWQMNRVTVDGSGQHGCFIQGSDSNAGNSVAFNCLSAGCGGLIDISFLGNTHTGVEVDDIDVLQTGRVHDPVSGNYFSLVDATPNIGQTAAPGTNSAIWFNMGPGLVGYPSWSATGTYNMSCGIYGDNFNNRSVFIGPYLEGGVIGRVVSPSLVYGGQGSWTNDTPRVQSQNGISGVITSNTGHGGFRYLDVGDPRGVYAYTAVTYNGVQIGSQNFVWTAQLDADSPSDLRLSSPYMTGSGFLLTGNQTKQTFGRTAPAPNVLATVTGLLAMGPAGPNARIHTAGIAPPTTGSAAAGEVVWNTSPAPGGTLLWSCTTGGTNGSGGTAVWTPLTLN